MEHKTDIILVLLDEIILKNNEEYEMNKFTIEYALDEITELFLPSMNNHKTLFI